MTNTQTDVEVLTKVIDKVVASKKKYPRRFYHGPIDMYGLEIMTLRCNLLLMVVDKITNAKDS